MLEDNIYSVPAVVSGARVRTSHIASNPLLSLTFLMPEIPGGLAESRLGNFYTEIAE